MTSHCSKNHGRHSQNEKRAISNLTTLEKLTKLTEVNVKNGIEWLFPLLEWRQIQIGPGVGAKNDRKTPF